MAIFEIRKAPTGLLSRRASLETRRMSSQFEIALIDDDTAVLLATRNFLQSFDYSVHAFASAEKFLASGMAGHICCLITDMQMAGMDGLELQAYMIENKFYASIIFVTGFPDVDLERRAMQAGALCYLTKPFEAKVLLSCVEVAKGRWT